MQLTLFTDYALRLLTYLGVEQTERFIPIQDVATVYGVSRHYLLKVANDLARLGYIEAMRGRNGGVRLLVDPESVKLGELVREMEPDRGVLECVGRPSSDCPIHRPCRLRPILGEAEAAFYDVLDRYTLADILSEPQRLDRLLQIRA